MSPTSPKRCRWECNMFFHIQFATIEADSEFFLGYIDPSISLNQRLMPFKYKQISSNSHNSFLFFESDNQQFTGD